ncbi:hypothetical protein EI94DRAFT_1830340 [Lactarius quietus]|nr:hypothetical protein EI94DRAFT_1830340 [Lactarius quietus]
MDSESNTPFVPPPGYFPDLVDRVKGMYRVLDLISESGSNGNVDKVIVAQDSLQRFINTISPGVYASITKVDFKILNQFSIKPLGIYGCRDEIVRLLQSFGAVDEELARLLLAPSEVNGPQLSSGLYIVTATEANPADERHYVIYWPEVSTWNDSAASSVRRNRVIFMRYLTKICDQVVALLSAGHSASLVWSDGDGDSDIGSGDIYARDSERLFTFEVAETIEQEESAVSRPGFQIKSSIIVPYEAPHYCSIDPSLHGPRLLPGETVQGLLTVVHIPPQVRTETLDERSYGKEGLSQLLKSNALALSEKLDEDALQTLVREALEDLFPKQCKDWHVRKQHIREIFMQERREKSSAVARDLADTEGSLQHALREKVVDHVVGIYPSLDRGCLSSGVGGMESSMRPSDIRTLYPTIEDIIERHIEDTIFDYVPTMCSDFKVLKFGVIALSQLLGENKHLRREARSLLFQAFVVEHDFKKALEILPKGSNFPTRWKSSFWSDLRDGAFNEESFKKEMRKTVALVSDSQFLQQIWSTNDEDLRSVVQTANALAQTELSSSIDAVAKKMTQAAMATQQDMYGRDMQLQVENEERELLNVALGDFIREINKTSSGQQHSTLYIDCVCMSKEKDQVIVNGRLEMLQMHQTSRLKLLIHPMELTSDDKRNMQLDANHIPTPIINDRLSTSFLLSTSVELAFYQLLENEKLLLVLADQDRFRIYLEPLPALDLDIERGNCIIILNRRRGVLFAFDEAKRTLVVYASTTLRFSMFVFDETYKALQGLSDDIDLAPCYSQSETSMLHMAYIYGREEVALVDSSALVRIFSFINLQFRPASVQLQTHPNAIYSSPDGSCLLVLHTDDSGPSLIAYHLESFGSTEGIAVDFPNFPLEGAILTSMASRGRVFFLGLDIHAQAVKSVAINITKKVKEFMFKEKSKKLCRSTRHTKHNSLLDCHAEGWTQFPVLPAVKRRAITSLDERFRKTLTFIADNHTLPFASYFSNLVQTFEKTTRKPTGDELSGIEVSAAQFPPFWNTILSSPYWNVSRYRVGEWLLDLLCLVPIHIAICHDNTFVPLANGVLSAELDRSLLGAEVHEIVDRLSFGWYESIFRSYADLKPIKVVSSMGQRSVEESYLLNHLVDTSFSGTEVGITEGVWMSVTPTDEVLVVSLEFEGVGGVERSLQEDIHLILFNTAISNLVVFRNNFSFDRDISGLFRSFQSSASVLDPAANPTLFQSTLVMIINDVPEPDTIEVTREFSLQFQQIVQQERGANFISRLHRGKLDIIPFPVIEVPGFYKLLLTLKQRLDTQIISYPTAGEFLYTIKTLMAKLKANDWRPLSDTMAEHRAKSLSAHLPIALATGYSDILPDLKPMKNLDSDLTVECDDTEARFAISDHGQPPSEDIEMRLTALRESWDLGELQQPPELRLDKKKKKGPGFKKSLVTTQKVRTDSKPVGELATHLSKLIDLRVNHVRLWLDLNLRRFQHGHAAIEDLRRRFDSLVFEMKDNVQLCRARCASCHLLCVGNRFHGGDHSCQTPHKCVHACRFCMDSTKFCGLSAGHPGDHVCVVSAHLCGVPCKLLGRRGCLEDCTKAIGHAGDEHMCSADVHMCSEPCALKNIQLPGGKTYSCQESCSTPCEQEHESHSCGTLFCRVTCELCKRCCNRPHLHGLTPGAHHLCGTAHPCLERFSALGICQIDSSPQSIEATSTGLPYTMYAQVAKRMHCVRGIPPGLLSHQGEHIHSKEEKPSHSCEARCKTCGYFCTLPLGHAQLEHETSHGYMTGTPWAVDSSDDVASLELGGRKFSSNKGNPVMCNLVCSAMGRHVHIDYCRTNGDGTCDTTEVQHLSDRISPEPDKPKDAITHSLYWKRLGFKDPYTRDEQVFFGKCDAICPGSEHAAKETAPGQPSYCTLPMFHPPQSAADPEDCDGYVSNDGHKFSCRNPASSP